jgi:2-oxoglutarate ferredoxin oxidoreductase subunit gamma
MKYAEIRLAGSGGQGMGLAGRIFSLAAILEDYNVCQTQSYGPEARGGASRTDIIISSREILFPNCRELDVLLAMNQESADKFSGSVRENGFTLVDSTFVDQLPTGKVYQFPLTATTIEQFGSALMTNLMALGMLAAFTRYFTLDTWTRAIKDAVPARFLKDNLRSFEHGHREGREILHVEEGRVQVVFDRKQPVPESLRRNGGS